MEKVYLNIKKDYKEKDMQENGKMIKYMEKE